MQGPVSGTVLCIREIGDPYVILNSFPCGKKSRPLSIIVHRDSDSPPVLQDTLTLRIIQTFLVLPGRNFLQSWLSLPILKKIICGFFPWERRGEERSEPRHRPERGSEKGRADQRMTLCVTDYCFVSKGRLEKQDSWVVLLMLAAWLSFCFHIKPLNKEPLRHKARAFTMKWKSSFILSCVCVWKTLSPPCPQVEN